MSKAFLRSWYHNGWMSYTLCGELERSERKQTSLNSTLPKSRELLKIHKRMFSLSPSTLVNLRLSADGLVVIWSQCKWLELLVKWVLWLIIRLLVIFCMKVEWKILMSGTLQSLTSSDNLYKVKKKNSGPSTLVWEDIPNCSQNI